MTAPALYFRDIVIDREEKRKNRAKVGFFFLENHQNVRN
jgi:hypothetical protein